MTNVLLSGTFPDVRSDRIPVVLDAGPAVHQNAGLARYTERLADQLWQNHRDSVALHLFVNRHSDHPVPDSLSSIPCHSLRLGQYPWRLGALASQLLALPLLERTLPAGGLYHATEHLLPRLTRPTVMTVHDLIFERYPQHHTRTNRAFLRVAMPLFVRRADVIIAVSNHTKQDLVELYHASPDKVHVIHEGIDEEFRPAAAADIQQVKERYGICRPYLLMVGTLEPRKNHAAAFQALARLRADGYPHCLVVVGGTGWLFHEVEKQVATLGLLDDVMFAGRVPEADLPALYSGADCFLMPSLYEGFGFPVLEAMACGTPVICSNTSSLPEVAGRAAVLVQPTDAEELAARLAQLLVDSPRREQMRQAGLQQARRFRWPQCAAETVEVYRTLP